MGDDELAFYEAEKMGPFYLGIGYKYLSRLQESCSTKGGTVKGE